MTSEPHSVRFWQIEEAVGGGHYIVLPDIFMCEESAKKAFPKSGGNFRAAEYQQGRGTDGPQRVMRTGRQRTLS